MIIKHDGSGWAIVVTDHNYVVYVGYIEECEQFLSDMFYTVQLCPGVYAIKKSEIGSLSRV